MDVIRDNPIWDFLADFEDRLSKLESRAGMLNSISSFAKSLTPDGQRILYNVLAQTIACSTLDSKITNKLISDVNYAIFGDEE